MIRVVLPGVGRKAICFNSGPVGSAQLNENDASGRD